MKRNDYYASLSMKRIEERIINAKDFCTRHPNLGVAKSYLNGLLKERASRIGKK